MTKTDNPWQVCRRLTLISSTQSLDEIAAKDERGSIVRLLNKLNGVIDITVITKRDAVRLSVTVCYDQRRIDFVTIHQALLSSGIHPTNGLWQRIKRSFYQYLDSNSRDIANTRPSPCCSNPTEILNQSRRKRQ